MQVWGWCRRGLEAWQLGLMAMVAWAALGRAGCGGAMVGCEGRGSSSGAWGGSAHGEVMM